jgi:hypothetical protein
MIKHWLSSPPNGYLGQTYGSNVHELLQQPMSTVSGDIIIQKMFEDIPVLATLPRGSVNIYIQDIPERPNDAKKILVELLGSLIE